MFQYNCVFRDHAGMPCGHTNVSAASFDQIERWASDLIGQARSRPKGVEIWHGEERLASLGTAFRPERNGRSSAKSRDRRANGEACRRQGNAYTQRRLSWFEKIVRSVWP